MNLIKKIAISAAVLAATPAFATETTTITTPVSGTFSETFSYKMPYDGYLSTTVTSLQDVLLGSLVEASNVDFTFATLTYGGVTYSLDTMATGRLEWRELVDQVLTEGTVAVLNVAGVSGSAGAYTAIFSSVEASIGGVPEVSTWIMMILGFGVTAYAMRKRSAVALAAA